MTYTAITSDLPVPDADLTSCDRCLAEALVRVMSPGGSILAFCGHHYRRYEVDLLAWPIVSDRRPATARS